MSKVVKFADGKDFKPGPRKGAGKIGRKSPRWPKEIKATLLGCAVAMAGTEEALERDRGWAGMGITQGSLRAAVDQVLPGRVAEHAATHGYDRRKANAYLYNRLTRMYNMERKVAPKGMPDANRGCRSIKEHLFYWKDRLKYMPFYEHALQFGTKRRKAS